MSGCHRRRRRPVHVLWVVFGLMLGVAAPTAASHVSEPTAAVTGTHLELAEYSTGTPAECGDTVDFRSLRVERFATVEAKPSEHFTTRFGWSGPRGVGQPYQLWPHQNVGPHGSLNLGHANIPMFFPGEYVISQTIQGDESGNRFELVCTITKG